MIQRTSSITCPHCSAKSTEVIP